MKNMNLDTKYTMRLSLKDIDNFKNLLQKYKSELPQKAENIVRRLSEVGLQDNYKSTEMIPIENDGEKITGGIRTTDEKDTYREFGTGIVGSQNPHPDIMNGWQYDVNEHGEKGWVYLAKDGTYKWTKGIPAQKKFYQAMNRMEDALPFIIQDEFRKIGE